MRHSTARLVNSTVRLAELTFPAERLEIHRTRLAFIHLDNVLHFAKIDRDGRVDGYVAAYLPDEVTLLYLRKGELVTATAIMEAGRAVIPIGAALKHIRQEAERGELVYADAPLQQLAWMYDSCAAPAAPRFVDPHEPDQILPALQHERFTGVVELIARGRVNYLKLDEGALVDGFFCGRREHQTVNEYLAELLAPGPSGRVSSLSAATFPGGGELPEQAPPMLVQTYRELFWAIAQHVEGDVAGEGLKRAYQVRDALSSTHPALAVLGTPLDREPPELVATPAQLVAALSDWSLQLLEQLEIVSPGLAPETLKEATREHRFVLQKAGFYERLPWTVRW